MERKDIPKEYKWNLGDIYENYEKWNEDLAKMEKIQEELVEYKGKFDNEDKLLEFLKKQEESEKIAYKLYRYPQLVRDLDSSDKEATENMQKIQFLFAKMGTELSWVNPELIENRENIEKWIQKKEFSDYKFGLENLFRLQSHVLDEDKSKLLSYYSSYFSAPRSIYSEITVTDVEWPLVTLNNGEEIQATAANYSKVVSTNRNQEDRKLIFENYYGVFEKRKNTIAAIYNSILQKNVANSKAYNYKSFLASALEDSNIPEDIYLNLINTAKESTTPLKRYIKLRKEILGLSEYHNYDGSINLVKFDKEYEYDDAKKIVLNSIVPLGKDYTKKINLCQVFFLYIKFQR